MFLRISKFHVINSEFIAQANMLTSGGDLRLLMADGAEVWVYVNQATAKHFLNWLDGTATEPPILFSGTES